MIKTSIFIKKLFEIIFIFINIIIKVRITILISTFLIRIIIIYELNYFL